jgi:oligopeptide transport system substrate-binding protein
MHSKIKSSFLLPLFAIVLAACGGASSSSQTHVTLDVDAGSTVAAPANPSRSGYRFGGWFRGRAGLTWLEPEAVSFPLSVAEDTTLFAYWEPTNSKAANYSADETYYSTLSSTAQRFILNPMTYETAAENSIMSNLSTPLYSSEVDWDKAIEQGVADFVGDFSKIEAKEFSIEALDFITILQGATSFPKNADGEDFTIDGKYDRANATKVTSTKWTYELRDDVFFEDGTQVTAETYEYTLKQFLDPIQSNFRSTGYYKDDENKSGLPILNASQYRKQTRDNPVAWSTVGFEVVDDFTFTLTTFEAIPQSFAVGFGSLQLVNPTVFQASLVGGNSTYGTPANPFRSYGPYVIKSWDENQTFVLNKNFEFIAKETITYKSISYSFTATVEENMNLFEAGSLSSVGLIGEFYTEYAEDPNVKREWAGYPQYLIVNTAPSTLETNAHQKHPIIQDPRFRQALFFGFNRAAYNSTIYAPNTPSVLPVPVDTKGYIQDPLYYSESPNHLENLEDFDITEGSNGYIPERAIALFNAALTDYLATPGAVNGPVTLKLSTTDNALSLSLANYIKSMYETLFNANPASPDKLIINVVSSNATSQAAERAAWDFDLMSINLGFGLSRGVWWQFAAFGFLGAVVGAGGFGLNLPFTSGLDAEGNVVEVDLRDDPDSWLMQDITVDLTPSYDYLVELSEDFVYEQDEDEDGELFYVNSGFAWLMDELAPTATKAAGLYVGSLYALADYVFNENTPWDAAAAEPFPGATEEVWKVTAAFESVFFEQMPLIPTATLSTATLYADNVTITWPTYSTAFFWGAARYRFLNTDPDFADGLYNAFEAAYLASLE